MSKTAETVYVLRDNFSGTLKKIQDAQRAFTKDLAGLQGHLDSLNRTKAEIKVEASEAKRELQDAKKAFNELGDAASKAGLVQSQTNYDELTQQLRAYEKQIKNVTKAMNEKAGVESKKNASARTKDQLAIEDDTSGTMVAGTMVVGKAILGSQLVSQFSKSVAAAVGTVATSEFGHNIGNTITTIGSGIASGLASGAALGTMIGGPIGTAIGAGAGAIAGAASGAIQAAAQKREEKDQYFKNTVSEIYQELIAIRQTMVSDGSTIAAERETLQMAFGNLLKSEAASVPIYGSMGLTNGKGITELLLHEVKVGTGADKNDYAADFLEKINVFSRETPFTYDELTSMSKTLLTYGYKSTEIFDLLTKLGDAGSALGWDTSSKVAVATYLGRMNLTDKATMEYINPLIERGIDVLGYIQQSLQTGDGTTKTTAEIMSMISAGELSGKAISKVLIEYMGFDYTGAMEELQNTFEGLQSTLAGWEADMQAAMGDSYNSKRKEQMEKQIAWYNENGDELKTLYAKVGEYEAELVGQKEAELRTSMDNILERAKEISTGEQMSAELYAAMAEAQTKYYSSDAYQSLYDSQKNLVETVRTNLAQTNYDCGYSLGEEFTKGYVAALRNLPDEPYEVPEWARQSNRHSPGYAFGISRIPSNNYIAQLHEGERVLTAGQARAFDAGNNSNTVTITGNTFVVRQDTDIDAIAYALYDKLSTASAIYAG